MACTPRTRNLRESIRRGLSAASFWTQILRLSSPSEETQKCDVFIIFLFILKRRTFFLLWAPRRVKIPPVPSLGCPFPSSFVSKGRGSDPAGSGLLRDLLFPEAPTLRPVLSAHQNPTCFPPSSIRRHCLRQMRRQRRPGNKASHSRHPRVTLFSHNLHIIWLEHVANPRLEEVSKYSEHSEGWHKKPLTQGYNSSTRHLWESIYKVLATGSECEMTVEMFTFSGANMETRVMLFYCGGDPENCHIFCQARE